MQTLTGTLLSRCTAGLAVHRGYRRPTWGNQRAVGRSVSNIHCDALFNDWACPVGRGHELDWRVVWEFQVLLCRVRLMVRRRVYVGVGRRRAIISIARPAGYCHSRWTPGRRCLSLHVQRVCGNSSLFCLHPRGGPGGVYRTRLRYLGMRSRRSIPVVVKTATLLFLLLRWCCLVRCCACLSLCSSCARPQRAPICDSTTQRVMYMRTL